MSKTTIVVFSRNRTLQLKSLLRSIQYHSDIEDPETHVLYRTDPNIPYDSLIDEFDCNFILEKNFLADLTRIVDGASSQYVLFLVDDLIFRDSFRLRQIERFMDDRQDVDCFSLRLGRNIQGGRPPQFAELEADMLMWDTAPGLGKTWNYFWDMTASMYRIERVSAYLKRCSPRRVYFPNPLETYYYVCTPTHVIRARSLKGLALRARFALRNKTNRMASWQRSKCFTQGVNLVASRNIDYREMFSPEELHGKMLEGYVADFKSLRDVENPQVHMGAQYFRLVKDGEPASDHGIAKQ